MVAGRVTDVSGDPVDSVGNAPERIDRVISREILRGELQPGATLGSVRTLAVRFDVNPSTVQRALARLEAKRLVTARHGSGVIVNDPLRVGDQSLFPEWIAALSDRPDEAAALLSDLLAGRRALAVFQIVRHRRAVAAGIDLLESAAVNVRSAEPSAAAIAELGMWRALAAAGGFSALSMLNTLERALEELPLLAEAMWSDPARNAARIRAIARAVAQPGDDLAARIDAAMDSFDRHVVGRYRELLDQD